MLTRRGALVAGAAALAGLQGCAVARLATAASAEPGLTLVKPPRLRPGDVVGLFAPSSAASEAQVAQAVANLEAFGLRTRQPRHLRAVRGQQAGTIEQRIEDFHTLWRDPEVKALWALRGGSSAAGMLPHLDYALLRHDPKIVIGYSDTTALLLALVRRAGLVCFHAPVAVSTFTDYTAAALRAVLMQPQPQAVFTLAPDHRQRGEKEPQYRARVLRAGRAEGRLVGGNLSVLSALIGTPYAADIDAAVLFLEEVREAPYRIDRMLTQLQQSQGLARAAALVAGVFERCEAPPDEPSLTLAQTLDAHLGSAGVPAVYGWSFGHVASQLALPLGVRARVDTADETLTLLEPAVT